MSCSQTTWLDFYYVYLPRILFFICCQFCFLYPPVNGSDVGYCSQWSHTCHSLLATAVSGSTYAITYRLLFSVVPHVPFLTGYRFWWFHTCHFLQTTHHSDSTCAIPLSINSNVLSIHVQPIIHTWPNYSSSLPSNSQTMNSTFSNN
jgi:hypothetical protein